MVYVLNIENNPLMPCSKSKARKLLRDNKARIIKYNPFTIKLLFECENKVQGITLGVDSGSKFIGLSATTKDKELFSSEVELRNDIVDLLATRSQNRRTRRSRLRYRQARFDNRTRPKGWLAPSTINKIDTHLRVVKDVHKILPINRIVVEVASFDIQKIKSPDIKGKEYQQGEQLGFWNTREYVLFRDGHKCKHCNGKSKDEILEVHHIESRKTGGNAPNNLVTLCSTCHSNYHKGKIDLKIKRGQSFKDATFMGIMRWAFYDKLKKLYPNVSLTYGYITKNTRIKNDLPKSHRVDARCISGNPLGKPSNEWYYQKKVRRHNRQIHKANILKGGVKRNNQAEYIVKGFRLFDKVRCDGKEYFIFGRRRTGSFAVRNLAGDKPNKCGNITFKKLQLVDICKGLLIEKRGE